MKGARLKKGGHKMEKTEMAKRYLGDALKIAAGTGLVIGAAYLISRIREKQATEARLARLEEILEKVSEEKGNE